MLHDIASLAAAFKGTMLDGLPLVEHEGGAVTIGGVNGAEVLAAWQVARDAMPVTGRRPVACPADGDHGPIVVDDFDQLQREIADTDPWAVFNPSWSTSDGPVTVDDLAPLLHPVAGLDLRLRAFQDLTFPTTMPILHRWVYDQILADPAALVAELQRVRVYTRVEFWYEPNEGVELMLLPTTLVPPAVAWLHYFGAAGEEAALGAGFAQWADRWGAEPVASWGTMLQFVVERRPARGDEAWELAGQLQAVGGSLQMDQWELALALTVGDKWFLHDRP